VPRGGRYPAGAHTGAVSASLRLRCDARAGVAPRNSLRSLRSLRSNNRGESDERSARVRAPTPALRFSPPHKSPPPGTAHRAATLVVFDDEVLGGSGKAGGGCASAATYAAPKSAGLAAARASAHRLLTRRDCSRAANAVSAASFATDRETEHRREPVAKRRAAESERRRTPARGFALLATSMLSARSIPRHFSAPHRQAGFRSAPWCTLLRR
jgi:hypothetical protein